MKVQTSQADRAVALLPLGLRACRHRARELLREIASVALPVLRITCSSTSAPALRTARIFSSCSGVLDHHATLVGVFSSTY
jgi:hypothetical protein